MTKAEQRADREVRQKKAVHLFEEIAVLFCTLVGVVISEAVQKRVVGAAAASDFLLDWPNLLVSAVIAATYYGMAYTQFKYSDNKKPPLIKRVANAFLTGIAWRTLMSAGGTK